MEDDCENTFQIEPLTVRARKGDLQNLTPVRYVEEDKQIPLECGMPPEEEMLCKASVGQGTPRPTLDNNREFEQIIVDIGVDMNKWGG